MNEQHPPTAAEATLEVAPSAPSLSIHIAGNVNIHACTQRSAPSLIPVAEGLANAAVISQILKNHRHQGEQTAPQQGAPVAAAAIIIRDPDAPLKVLADGKQIDARETVTDHVALIFPETGTWVHPTPLTRNGEAFASQQDVEAAAKAIRVLDFDDWFLCPDTVYDRHVIDRRFRNPAADPNLYPNLNLSDWYWTSTLVPQSESSAFGVNLNFGGVSGSPRGGSGFGLACRRARQ